MRAHFLQRWDALRTSYWFLPSLMAVAAVALSFATTALDGVVGEKWLESIGWLYANKPDGARALLSTIAGSMITVAGVTFSITIAALAYASSQFGPRLLTNFMQDRGNQITLGTFIATFLYCLLVLRTVRSADEVTGQEQAADVVGAFVPHIAILCGLMLALASLGVLIFFIHHIPDSIHASHVIAEVGRELDGKIDELYPQHLGEAPPDARDPAEDVPEDFFDRAAPVEADGTGYLQHLDTEGLAHLAQRHDLLLRVAYRPGDFVATGRAVAFAYPSERADEDVLHAIRNTFAWGRRRTQSQDVLFLVNELVEIAGRALSPGVNDPFTAIACMNWLGAALAQLARREIPSPYRFDDDGTLRLIAYPITFDTFAEAIFDQLRPYASTDRNAALYLMKILAEVAYEINDNDLHTILARHGEALNIACEHALPSKEDAEAVTERYRVFLQVLSNPAARLRLDVEHDWLRGSG